MASFIVDELVAQLEYRIEGEKNIDKFNKKLDESEKKTRKRNSSIERTGRRAASATKRNERSIAESLGRTNKAFGKSNSIIKSHSKLIGGAAIGFGAVKLGGFAKDSLSQYAALERQLTRIGVTADSTEAQTIAALGTIQGLSIDFGFPDVSAAREALDALTASGAGLQESLDFLPSVLATSQASGANSSDIANTARKASTALKIQTKDMQEAFDIMVAGGKAGQFELKDMAKFIPSLASKFQVLGGSGLSGLRELIALLQTLRTRTGDSSSAAIQLDNILGKINSEETAGKFKKFGINLDEELASAKANGEGLIDAFIRLTKVAIDGDTTRFSKLFTDTQFRAGMIALVQGTDDLEGFLKTVNSSELKGGVFRDLSRVMQDTQADLDRLSSNWDRFKTNLGAGIGEIVTPTLQDVNAGFDKSRALETLQTEQREIDKKEGFKQGAIGKFFGSEIGLDKRIGQRVLKTEGFDAFNKLPIPDERKIDVLLDNDIKVSSSNFKQNKFDANKINEAVGFKRQGNLGDENRLSMFGKNAGADLIQRDLANVTNNSTNTTNQTISIEQNVQQATDAPSKLAKASGDAIKKLSQRAQLEQSPSF